MKKKNGSMKRILVSVLAVALMVCCFPAPAVRAEESESYTYYYNYFIFNRNGSYNIYDLEGNSNVRLAFFKGADVKVLDGFLQDTYVPSYLLVRYGGTAGAYLYLSGTCYNMSDPANGLVPSACNRTLTGVTYPYNLSSFNPSSSYANYGIELDTNIPIYTDLDDMEQYFLTGDTSKSENLAPPDVRDDAIDRSYYLKDFETVRLSESVPRYEFVWSGLYSDSGAGRRSGSDPDKIVHGGYVSCSDDSFVDVTVGLVSLDNLKNVEEVSVDSLITPGTVYIKDKSVIYNLDNLKKDNKVVRYVKFQPYAHIESNLPLPNSEEGSSRWYKCKPSYAYFNVDGQYSDVPDDHAGEDYFIPEFDTGYDWLDTLLNKWADFINAILKAIYYIRDLIYNRDGSGLLNLLRKFIGWAMNPLNFLIDLFDFLSEWLIGEKFSSIFRRLFIPRADYFPSQYDRLVEIVPAIGQINDMQMGILDIIRGRNGVSPTITIPLSLLNSVFHCRGIDDFVVDFSWYDPYRNTFHMLISSYLYIRFALNQFFAIKSLFNATSSASDAISYWGD